MASACGRRFWFALLLLLLPHPASAQLAPFSLGYFFSEDELTEAFRSGDLSFDDYLNLLQFIQERDQLAPSDTLLTDQIYGDRPSSVVPPANFSELKRGQLYFPIEPAPERQLFGSFRSVYTDQVTLSGRQETYTNGRFQYGDEWKGNLSFQKFSSQQFVFRRRSLTRTFGQGGVTVGNFEQKFGNGLLFGHHWRILDKTLLPDDDFFTLGYPTYTRYNGLLFYWQPKNQARTFSLFVSTDRNANASEQLIGSTLERKFRHWTYGVGHGINRTKNAPTGRSIAFSASSIYASYGREKISIQAEAAQVYQHGNGAAIEAAFEPDKDKWVFVSAWNYGKNFLWPHSGGRASSDYLNVTFAENDFEYRSPQVGENGFLLKSLVQLTPRFSSEFKYTNWNQFDFSGRRYRLYGALNYNDRAHFVTGYLRSDSKKASPDSLLRQRLGAEWSYQPNTRLATYLNGELRGDNDALSAASEQVRIAYRLTRPLTLTGWFKYFRQWRGRNFDYWQGYIAEMLELNHSLRVGAKFLADFNRTRTHERTDFFRVEVEGRF